MSKRSDQTGDDSSNGRKKAERLKEGTAIALGAASAAVAVINPIAGVVAAGIAPYLANRLNGLYEARLKAAVSRLDQKGLIASDGVISEENEALKMDALRDYLVASMETESAEKADLLLHLIDVGLSSESRVETLFARRVIRTLMRIDELEMIALASISRVQRNVEGVTLKKLVDLSTLIDPNMMRSALSVLQSEGLVTRGESNEKYKISDYGSAVLRELRSSRSKGEAGG